MRGPIARNTMKTSLVLGLRLAVQAGTLLLVTRILGPHDFGIFAGIAALAVTLGALSPFGMHLVVLGKAARDNATGAEVLRYAIPTTLAIGAGMLAVYAAITQVAFAPEPGWWPVIVAVGIAELLLQPLLALPACRLQGAERITTGLLLQNAPLLLRMLAIGGIAIAGVDDPLQTYAWCYVSASLLVLAALFLPGMRVFDDVRGLRWPRRAELGEASGYAAIGVSAAAPGEVDKALALRLLPSDAAGIYSASARVIGALTLPVTAMILSALPRLFRESATPGTDKPLLPRMFIAAGSYGVLLALLLVLGAPAIGRLFGHEYSAMPELLRGLAWAVPGITLRQSAGAVLMSMGRPWMRVGYELGGVVVLGITTSLLVPRFDMQGMVFGLVCAEWSMVALGIACIARIRMTSARARNLPQQP